MRKIYLLAAAVVIVAGCGFWTPKNPPAVVSPTPGTGAIPPAVLFQAADGPCQKAGDCQELQYGCGKLVCTSTPDAFANLITDCLVQRTPKDDGFACTCVAAPQRCGWVK